MKKYDKLPSVMRELFMEECGPTIDIELYKMMFHKQVYGYVIGHWTTEEEEDCYDSQVVFRRVVKKQDLTEEWINDVDNESEFIGVLYDYDDTHGDNIYERATFTMILNEELMQFDSFYVGVRVGGIKY